MDQLTKEQRESLKKTNNERLRARLVKFGVEEELVFTSERDELLEMMAVQMIKPAGLLLQMLNRRSQKLLRCVCVKRSSGKNSKNCNWRCSVNSKQHSLSYSVNSLKPKGNRETYRDSSRQRNSKCSVSSN